MEPIRWLLCRTICLQTDKNRELFTDENSGLGLEDGLEILECDGLSMEKDGNSVKLQTLGSGGGRLELSLRSGGNGADE